MRRGILIVGLIALVSSAPAVAQEEGDAGAPELAAVAAMLRHRDTSPPEHNWGGWVDQPLGSWRRYRGLRLELKRVAEKELVFEMAAWRHRQPLRDPREERAPRPGFGREVKVRKTGKRLSIGGRSVSCTYTVTEKDGVVTKRWVTDDAAKLLVRMERVAKGKKVWVQKVSRWKDRHTVDGRELDAVLVKAAGVLDGATVKEDLYHERASGALLAQYRTIGRSPHNRDLGRIGRRELVFHIRALAEPLVLDKGSDGDRATVKCVVTSTAPTRGNSQAAEAWWSSEVPGGIVQYHDFRGHLKTVDDWGKE